MIEVDLTQLVETHYYEPPQDELDEINALVHAAVQEVAATGEDLATSRILFRDKLKAVLNSRIDPYVIDMWGNKMDRWNPPSAVPSLKKIAYIKVGMTIDDPKGIKGRAYYNTELTVPQWWGS